MLISRHQWISHTFGPRWLVGHVGVFDGRKALISRAVEDPWLGLCAMNVVHAHSFLSLYGCVDVLLGLRFLDIPNAHLISNELRRCDRSKLDFAELVYWIEGVVTVTDGSKLNTLRRGALDVFVGEVSLRLV